MYKVIDVKPNWWYGILRALTSVLKFIYHLENFFKKKVRLRPRKKKTCSTGPTDRFFAHLQNFFFFLTKKYYKISHFFEQKFVRKNASEVSWKFLDLEALFGSVPGNEFWKWAGVLQIALLEIVRRGTGVLLFALGKNFRCAIITTR